MTFAVEGLQTSVHTHVLVSPIQFEPGTESSRWRANRLPLRRLFILLAFLGGGAGLVGVRQWREARREETGPKQNSDGGDGGEGGVRGVKRVSQHVATRKFLNPLSSAAF